MKRITAILLLLAIFSSFCACSTTNTEKGNASASDQTTEKSAEELEAEQRVKNAAAVDNMIHALGTITLESDNKIEQAEAKYNALTEAEKELVANKEELVHARTEYDRLVEQEFVRSHNVIVAKIDTEGSAFLPMEDGSTIELHGSIVRATLTQNKKNIIVLEKDGLLYYVSTDAPNEKHKVCDSVSEVTATRADGLLYVDGNNELHRFLFADNSDYVIGTSVAYAVADHALTVLSADADGYIYVTKSTEEKTVKIGSYDKDEILLKGVSNDGSTALWVEKQKSTSWRDKNNTYWTYLYADGERNYLGETSNTSESTTLRFNKDQTFACVINLYESTVFLKYPDTDTISVKLVKSAASTRVYTADSVLDQDPSAIEDGIYVLIDNDEGSDLYYISSSGDREKVISRIEDIFTANGRVYYRNVNNELFTAKLDGYNLLDEEKISNEVHMLKISPDGKTVFYVKNIDKDSVGSLLYWQVGDEKSQKITSNCYSYWIEILGYNFYIPYFYLNEEGDTVYYFENKQEVADGHLDIGDLKCMEVGSEPVRIATDIIIGTLTSGRTDGTLRSDMVRMDKYLYVDDDDRSQVDWIYYDGTATNPIAREVYYTSSEQTEVAENMAE